MKPGQKQLIAQHQDHRADKESDDAGGDEAADCTDKDHRHGDLHAAPEQDGLQDVVDAADEEAPDHEEYRRDGIRRRQDIDHERDGDRKDSDLDRAEQQTH
jgi:hypothetical protein